ncbi:hypothetical protein C0971_09895 [Bacillus methanolicus]|uniref:hypothetical protein n=1 Tax=Bacillus methanolicus TaxID=1471 RepID=UPI00200CADDB|nr:hypothetical protein [Bacillus methanolicus]UQD52287.1 hypothetical protein C0971_09895 [Bacillus methanolicus]
MSNRTNKKNNSRPSIPKPSIPSDFKVESKIFPKKSQDEVERLNKEKIFFSFRFLDTNHKSFNCGKTDASWFLHLFDNFNEISKLTMLEFEQQRQHYDLHRHDFSKTAHHYNESVPNHILEQISPENMIQFRLSSSGGRVHGIRYHNQIYVIWLDPYHNMNPNDRFGPPKLYPAPLRPYEILLYQYSELEKQLKEKEEENEILLKMLEEIEDKKTS